MALNAYGQPEEICGYKTLFRETGYYLSRGEQYEKSLIYFDQGVSKTPDDKRTLIGRGRARAKACLYEGAIEDVTRALKLDPDDPVVLADKALSTYLSCEFEKGLVQNIRLVPVRQKPDNFVMGVMHCTNSIENCLGERAGRPLRDHFLVIRKLAWKKNYEAQKPFEPKPKKKKKKKKVIAIGTLIEPVQPDILKIKVKKQDTDEERLTVGWVLGIVYTVIRQKKIIFPPYNQPFRFRPLQNFTTNIENYMAEKYLDSMYLDKLFLKELQTKRGANCPNAKGSSMIKKLAKNGYKTVCYKQELLRTRRPFYYIKFQEAISTGALKERQEHELFVQQQLTIKEADTLIVKLNDAFRQKKLRPVLEVAEKLKLYCDSKPKRLLENKEDYLQEMYAIVRRGFYEHNRLNKSQPQWDQNKRIYQQFGVPVTRTPSNDSIVNEFKDAFIDYKKSIATFEERLRQSNLGNEMCWCYHELSRLHADIKRFEMASVYARKCIQEGTRSENMEWVLNATMLLVKINVLQHNRNDAKNFVLSAIKVAQGLNDSNLEEYLVRCLEVVETLEFDDATGPELLEKRQKKIISMMATANMKDDVANLFQLMSAMPASRRMVVMPGIRIEDVGKPSASAASKSIMPKSKDEEDGQQFAKKSPKGGATATEDTKKGS
ncbi:hypothetical protein NQ317_013110 [Molorchus minor]|uniref:Tetratricopeptide repeat protein 25 n=1 Tax=Molorchus minor TaxID=1323400 RepID=A0ABQ9JXP8_9CUCU|nr:hypothetical protein NQ317_013110 [Molorchus minor]